jgi:hypothetical protein
MLVLEKAIQVFSGKLSYDVHPPTISHSDPPVTISLRGR